MITFFKIILVSVLLMAMLLVLVLIGHVANPRETATNEERDRLRHDVETRERVITHSSIFHQFFARPERKK